VPSLKFLVSTLRNFFVPHPEIPSPLFIVPVLIGNAAQTALTDLATLRKREKNAQKTFTNTIAVYAVRQRLGHSHGLPSFYATSCFFFHSLDCAFFYFAQVFAFWLFYFHPFTAFLMGNKFCNSFLFSINLILMAFLCNFATSEDVLVTSFFGNG
jgi:hypothetical protein